MILGNTSHERKQPKAPLLIMGAFLAFAMLFLPGSASAEELRLDDVFTSPSLSGNVITMRDIERTPVSELFELLESDLTAGRAERVLEITELLTAWLRRDSPDYGRALWFRARAYRQLQRGDELLSICLDYLNRFSEGEERGWFLLRLAEENERRGSREDATTLWLMILDDDVALTPDEGLSGARLLISMGRPRGAREILRRAFESPHATVRQRRQRDDLLLDTLLVLDDADVPIPPSREEPPAETASYELRRALLLEIRGHTREAAAVFDELAGLSGDALSPLEKALLEERRGAPPVWPPENASP